MIQEIYSLSKTNSEKTAWVHKLLGVGCRWLSGKKLRVKISSVFPINSSHWILVVIFQPALMDPYEHMLDNDKMYFLITALLFNLLKHLYFVFFRPMMLIFDLKQQIFGQHHRQIEEQPNCFLSNSYAILNSGFREVKTIKYCKAQVIQQGNNVDCGLYLLHYFKTFYCDPQVVIV